MRVLKSSQAPRNAPLASSSPKPETTSQSSTPIARNGDINAPSVGALPSLPDGMPALEQGKVALELLEKFLAAKNLAERLPYIETKKSESELANTAVASPLPVVSYIELAGKESVRIEQLTDFYHTVHFQTENNQINKQTILVRIRSTSDPKVVVDPFLDSYGGRLAGYAKSPNRKSEVFQVILAPIAACNDEGIPFPDKKRTLKLLACEGTKEIARAYFSKQSEISQMLDDGTYSFNYGSAKACTIRLTWNSEEDSDHPFLEAVAISAMNWNP